VMNTLDGATRVYPSGKGSEIPCVVNYIVCHFPRSSGL